MLSEPNISYKPFWGICRPLNSWRANSPNPIQIYCAQLNEFIENIKNVTDEEKKAMLDNANKFILVAKMYQKMGVDSYAMVQNISTISKLRVLKPINKYDPILKIRVSDEIMTILDNKLIELFTK